MAYGAGRKVIIERRRAQGSRRKVKKMGGLMAWRLGSNQKRDQGSGIGEQEERLKVEG